MPSRVSKVKDKRIQVKGLVFKATVEYYNDTPERDEDAPVTESFGSMHDAQEFLASFPRDIWDGQSFTAFNYIEMDERFKRGRSKETVDFSWRVPNKRERLCWFGRSLASNHRM